MNIYALKGHKVRCKNLTGGYDSEKDLAKKHLEIGKEYTIEKTIVDNWSTDVWLEEIPDVRFNSVFFERLIAAFKHTGNVGFLIYLADSCGYVGSVGVMLSKEIFKVQLNWVTFFSNSVIWLSLVGLALTLFSAIYFYTKYEALVKNADSRL
jgi:hypothetical protein